MSMIIMIRALQSMSISCSFSSMSGSLPFAVETKDDEDEDEKISEAVQKGKWSFDSKAFARSTSEVKDFITALMFKDAK